MTEDEPRNLQDGWCDEGASWSTAVQHVDPEEWERLKTEFPLAKEAEQVAALFLYSFTKLIPTNQDKQQAGGDGYNGAVDVLLTDAATGERQVMEVTTSLDESYQRASKAVEEFERRIAQRYTGEATWTLGLERGWESERLKELATVVADALNDADGTEAGRNRDVELHPKVTARQLGPTDPPIVYVDSTNAGASSFGARYLDSLTDYLESDPVIGRKLEKLEREGLRFNATRRHLFIGMTGTGARGGLLPASPSYFTWGEFRAPANLDDLWLWGRTGLLYHWSREAGWIFHSVE